MYHKALIISILSFQHPAVHSVSLSSDPGQSDEAATFHEAVQRVHATADTARSCHHITHHLGGWSGHQQRSSAAHKRP